MKHLENLQIINLPGIPKQKEVKLDDLATD